MNIRLRNIPKFQNGGVPQWYIDRYGNRTSLLRWNNNLDYSAANKNLNQNNHYNAGNLDTVFLKNQAYILDKNAVTGDILAAYNDFGLGMSAEDFVNLYNKNAATIRSHWNTDLTYGERTAGDHNRLFFRMFRNRSNQNVGDNLATYNIGYLNNLEDIEGSSTWLRRMDLYENEFDFDNPDENRIHEITLSDGKKVRVYKKANGDIGLVDIDTKLHQASKINNPLAEISPTANIPEEGIKLRTGLASIVSDGGHKFGLDWSKIKENALKLLNDPNLHSLGRLAYNLYSNNRIYGEAEKAIKPNLTSSYHTYRQVVGDEATKLAYYRRAAEGITKASRPMTSDADKQMAYQMEAQRAANELRAQGDLADNQMIQKTSDESNQHLWANTQRDNLVANANRAALNDYNARLHNLRALHKAANASSIDNAWKEYQTRLLQRNKELQAIEDEIFAYQLQLDLLNDETYQAAVDKVNAAKKAATTTDSTGAEVINYNDDNLKKAQSELQQVLLNIKIRRARELLNYYKTRVVKTGGKITWKKKDDLLYRSARDVVEHFRKMTKLSYDSVSKRPKEVKLVSHPKGSTKKYLQGGVAPFLVYTPAVAGGETASASNASSSSKKSSDDLGLDLLKELFQLLKANGLPSDVNAIYSRIGNLLQLLELFGNALSTDDIQSLYVSAMLLLNRIKYEKELYDNVLTRVRAKDAGFEYAVTGDGRFVVQNLEGEISVKSWKDIDLSKDIMLTNDALLNLRALSLPMNTGLTLIADNATSMSEIGKFLKAQLPAIENTETVIEGYTKKDANLIKEGIKVLADAPEGDYKYTETIKNNSEQVKLALDYLYRILPKNMLALLIANSNGEPEKLILDLVMSKFGSTYKYEISAVTGKASSNTSGSGSDDITPAVALAMGLGDRQSITILDKTADGLQIDVVSLPLLDSLHHPMANATLFLVGNGDYAGLLDLGLATMGGVKIDTNATNEILIDRGRIYSAELPIDKLAAMNGVYKPDLSFLKNIEKADAQIRELGITDRNNLTAELILTINKVYLDNQLPIIYTIGSNGQPILTQEYRRFAILHATAPENVFQEDLSFNDGVVKASDDDRTRFESMMKEVTNNDKYKFDSGLSIFGTRVTGTELYKGLLYIPMSNSTISALSSTGYKASPESFNKIEAADLQAEFIRSSGYQSAGSWKK